MAGPVGDDPDAPEGMDPRHLAVLRAQAHVWKKLADGIRRPWVTMALLATLVLAHVVVGLVGFSQGGITAAGIIVGDRPTSTLITMGAMYSPRIRLGEVWRLVSCIFLHGDGMHILLNGIALYGLGRLCESVYGPARFLWLFLVAGVTGSTLSFIGGNVASVGASGSIFGLMGACIVFGHRYRLVLPPHIGEIFRKKLMPWVGLNLMIGFVLPFVDNLGHVGGLLGGAIFAAVASNRIVPAEPNRRETRWVMGVTSGVLLMGTLVALLWSWVELARQAR